MPNPDASGTSVDLSAAPGADFNLDDLFPVEAESFSAAQPQAEPPTEQPPVPPPQAESVQREFFLKTPTGTVYKTEDEAIRGFAHKDEVIERLRAAEIARTGIDPITGKSARETSQPQAVNYAADGKRYYKDLVEAVEKRDEEAYARVQGKFLADYLAPAVPILADVARQKAVRQVSQEVQGFGSYIDSPDYRDTLEAIPTLKQAITFAEQDLNQSANLPELYRLAYFAGQGRKVPEIVKTAVAQSSPVTPPQASRPTTSPSHMTPPPPTSQATANWASDRTQRQQLIKDMESRGIQDRNLDTFGR